MESPSPLISWVNPFPCRFINRTIFLCDALELHECAWWVLFDARQYYCHFSISIGSFLYQRAKPPQGTVKSTRERVLSKEVESLPDGVLVVLEVFRHTPLRWRYTWIQFERHFRKFQKGIEERKLYLEYQHTVALNQEHTRLVGGLFGWPYIKLFLTISPHFLLFWEKSSRITCSLRTPRPICRSSQIYRKISQKYAKHPLTLICVLNIGFLYCLKRARANKIFPLNQF